MSKYSQELKCIIAKQYLDGTSSLYLAKQYSISSRQIRYWAQVFTIHGTDSFLPTKHAATAQTKRKALNLMWTNEWSLTHTSAVLNLSSPGILSVWLKRFNELGIKGLKVRQKGRPSMKQQPQRTTKPDNEMTLEELKEELVYLRTENAVLKKLEELEQEKKPSNKEKAVIALTLKGKYPLKYLLQTLQLAKSVFYYQAQTNKRPNSYERELRLIKSIYHEHKGRYGYRRIHLELKNQGFVLNHKTVQRLMALLNLKSTVRVKKYRSYRGESGAAAPNVLKRDFSATQPDEKWVTDVTEFKVKEQKVYLSPVVDLFTQEVVAYRVAKNTCLPLVTDMLTEAISTLKPNSKPIIHSDQGWQYRHRQYKKKVAESGLTQSMSRKGNCLDNAVAENFFALLKTEMYHNQSFEDADALIEQIKEYIEYYNTKRIKVKLKGLTPIEYRTQALKAA